METENLIGQQVDQYRITALLERGGMAEVFIAQDVNLQREVALKVMLATLAQNESFATRFRREAQTTARLNHPNIVQVYGAGFTPAGRPYLAMQYIRGGSLQDWLEKLAQTGQTVDHSRFLENCQPDCRCLEHRPRSRHHSSRPETEQYPAPPQRHTGD